MKQLVHDDDMSDEEARMLCETALERMAIDVIARYEEYCNDVKNDDTEYNRGLADGFLFCKEMLENRMEPYGLHIVDTDGKTE